MIADADRTVFYPIDGREDDRIWKKSEVPRAGAPRSGRRQDCADARNDESGDPAPSRRGGADAILREGGPIRVRKERERVVRHPHQGSANHRRSHGRRDDRHPTHGTGRDLKPCPPCAGRAISRRKSAPNAEGRSHGARSGSASGTRCATAPTAAGRRRSASPPRPRPTVEAGRAVRTEANRRVSDDGTAGRRAGAGGGR